MISLILFTLFSCSNNKKDKEIIKEKVIEKDMTKKDTLSNNVKKQIKDCFKYNFEETLKDFEVKQETSKEIIRGGILDCFIKNNQKSFSKLVKETDYQLSKNEKYKDIIHVKAFEFEERENAETIFKNYKKGFHNRCIGMKEPNFIIMKDKYVYVFYVDTVFYKNELEKFKKIFIYKISNCLKVNVTVCQ